MEVSETLTPERWLEAHGDALFRRALAQVGSREAAEDLVQETLLAAWRGREGFREGSAERTWLVGILNHKVNDHFRRRYADRTEEAEPESLDGWLPEEEALFRPDGHWAEPVPRWGANPAGCAESDQLWEILRRCIDLLPAQLREGFVMRELSDMGVEVICRLLGVSDNHFYVLMHRCRLRLRGCIERHGLGED